MYIHHSLEEKKEIIRLHLRRQSEKEQKNANTDSNPLAPHSLPPMEKPFPLHFACLFTCLYYVTI